MPVDGKSIDYLGIADGYSEHQEYEPSEADQKLAANLHDLFTTAFQHRGVYERRWDFHRLYLKGEVLPMKDRYTGEVVTVRVGDVKKLYSINNQLSPTARSLVAKLSRMIPAFVITPPTNDTMEVYGARVADNFLAYMRQKERFDVKFVEAQENLAWCGTYVMQLEWNPEGGREFAACGDCGYKTEMSAEGQECPFCAETLQVAQQQAQQISQINQKLIKEGGEPGQEPPQIPQEAPKLALMCEGDVEIIMHDTRDVYVEPGPVDPTKLRYIFIRKALPITEIRAKFPHMAAFLKPEGDVQLDKGGLYSNIGFDEGAATRSFLNDYAYLYEYHEKPSLEFPKGRIIYMCNDFILDEREGFYDLLKRLPFYFGWWTRRPGEFWGESFIAQAWHRQKELNNLETKQREHLELCANPRLLTPMRSKIRVDELEGTTGQVVAYNPAMGEPHYLNTPPLSSDIYNRRAFLIDEIRQQGGVTANDAGQMGSDPNGRAMAIVQAEADQQIGPITVRNFNELGELFRGVLIFVQKFYDRERIFTVPGEESNETYTFDELNLSPGWDVRLEVQDGLSQNQAIRVQEAMNLLTTGVLGNPQMDPQGVAKRFAKIAKLKLPGIGSDPSQTEFASALEIPAKIMRGEPVQPTPFDDPIIFADALTGWLRTLGRRRGLQDPVVQQVMQAWMYYTQVAQSQAMGTAMPQPLQQGGNQGSQPGSTQSAPGGSPNNTMQGDRPIAASAEQNVQQADKAGESAARGGQKHEG